MPKVRMLVSVAGDPTASPGEVVDMSDDDAERFVARGLAEPVKSERKTKAKTETAAADSGDVEEAVDD